MKKSALLLSLLLLAGCDWFTKKEEKKDQDVAYVETDIEGVVIEPSDDFDTNEG